MACWRIGSKKIQKYLQSFFPRINITPFAPLKKWRRTCLEQQLQKTFFSAVNYCTIHMFYCTTKQITSIVSHLKLIAPSLLQVMVPIPFSQVPCEFSSVPMQGVRQLCCQYFVSEIVLHYQTPTPDKYTMSYVLLLHQNYIHSIHWYTTTRLTVETTACVF